MLSRAAVTMGKGEPFRILNIHIAEPKKDEVVVRIVGTGICHTDLTVRDAKFPVTYPIVLGHEGAGIVEQTGENVKSVRPGDHVVLSYSSCGSCPNCYDAKPYACDQMFQLNFGGKMPDGTTQLKLEDGTEVASFSGQSSFSQYAVVHERNVVKVPKEIPLKILGPLGCGIQTGCGAVLNKLKPRAGSSMVVFGCGSVGLSAVMAGTIAGCTTIIAVDVHEHRLKLAQQFLGRLMRSIP